MMQGLNIPFTDQTNIKSTLDVMMFGRGSVFLLPFYKQKEKTKDLAGKIMKLITTLMITALTIPKVQLQLCRIKTNNKR